MRAYPVRNRVAASLVAVLLALGASPFAQAGAYADPGDTAPDAAVEAPAAETEPAQGVPEGQEQGQEQGEPEGQEQEQGQGLQGASSDASSPSAPSGSSQAAALTDHQAATADEAKEAKAKAEKEAQEKLAQAESLYALEGAMAGELARFQGELEAAQHAFEEVTAQRDAKRAERDAASKELDAQREALSDMVVALYKGGGVTTYIDIMLKSMSYREFLTSWYMLNAATDFGGEEFVEQKRAVDVLEAEAEKLEKQADDAKKALVKAQASVDRTILSQLALDQQAATLRVEAASLTGDGEALAVAQADLDWATTALDEARSQGVGRSVVLEGEGVFTNPCPGATYSSGFGYRSFDNAFHKGLDMAIAEGSPYYAAESGTVIAATNDGGYNGGAGNWVVIDHGSGYVTKYMHSLTTLVGVGEHVERGQLIGLVGNTGNSFGAHLHFQVEVGGVPVNPVVYL